MDRNSSVPTAAEIRAQARAALKGNWKGALGICAVDTLTMMIYGFVALGLLDRLLIPVLYGEAAQGMKGIVLPVILWVLIMLGGLILISPFYTIGISRLACRIANRERIDYSLLHIPVRELFKGAWLMLLCAVRAVIVPVLVVWIVGMIVVFLTYRPGMPDGISTGAMYGVLVPIVGVICRRIFECIPVFQLMVRQPSASAWELVKRSQELMKGSKWRLFCLLGSFVGWGLLYGAFVIAGEEMFRMSFYGEAIFAFVCSFVSLPLTVYIQTALAVFVKDLSECEEVKK